jgi:thiol:disulfide interchange protein DsbD
MSTNALTFMGKFLLIASILFSQSSLASLFGESTALPADQAIQFTTTETHDALLINFELAKNIYLYQDKIKLTFEDKSPYSHFTFTETAETIEDPSFGRVPVFYNSATLKIDRSALTQGSHNLILKYQGCDEAIGLCYPPQKTKLTLTSNDKKNTDIQSEPSTDTAHLNSSENLHNASGIHAFLLDASVWLVVITFLILGIGLTFTPCVLPMIPILSSVIAGQKGLTTRTGFIISISYVLGMAITFALAGIAVGLLGARFNLQIYMQQPWVLGLFSGLFILLALSMFGLYELKLPRFIQDPLDKLNQKQKGGNLISVFLMGALSAVVVSPCVSAPLAGALVYISTTGDAVLGGTALFAMGLGMGLPLIAIGTTGASVFPKAGIWMDQVKIFFGVLLLAVAIWVLGRVLPESIYLSAWALLLGVYSVVLGAFEAAKTNKQRIAKGFALLLFIISATLIFNILTHTLQPKSLQAAQFQPLNNNPEIGMENTGAKESSNVFFQTISEKEEFEIALNNAQENGQLVFVDIYADWCIECKIMSSTIFSDPEVQAKLDDFIRIKLDITAFNEFHKSYLESQGVFGPPSLIFYGLDGNAISEAKLLGEISKPDFLNHLEQFDP